MGAFKKSLDIFRCGIFLSHSKVLDFSFLFFTFETHLILLFLILPFYLIINLKPDLCTTLRSIRTGFVRHLRFLPDRSILSSAYAVPSSIFPVNPGNLFVCLLRQPGNNCVHMAAVRACCWQDLGRTRPICRRRSGS
jgi:hypothetical protein